MNSSSATSKYYAVFTTANAVGVLVCLVAIGFTFCNLLHRQLIYRLALYQVFSSLALSLVELFQVTFINYNESSKVYREFCSVIGFLTLYCQWVKVFFTVWVTFHIFCFAVLHKKMQKLELMYVATSILAPVLIAAVPVTTDTYSLSPTGIGCFVFVKNASSKINDGIIERLSLWVCPAIAVLAATSVAMFIVVSRLTVLACRESNQEVSGAYSEHFWTAVRQLLPLFAFPVLFCLTLFPELAADLSRINNQHENNEAVTFLELVSAGIWGIASGLTLIIHVAVTRCGAKRRQYQSLLH